MIVKKYSAPTETEAVLTVKKELGSDAVILNVKKIKHRGIIGLFKKPYVEVMAALEEKDFVANVNDRNKASKSIDLRADDEAKERVNTSTLPPLSYRPVNPVPQTMPGNAIEEKLDSIHGLLKEQMESEKKEIIDKRTDVSSNNLKYLKLIYNKLIDNELDERYANQLIDEVQDSIKSDNTLDGIISAVYQKIILKLDEPQQITYDKNRPKLIVFMGPTGVGKTTTIAKLASACKLTDGKNVGFITADTYRIAAVEQLNTYAGILDVPVQVVYEAGELDKAFAALSNCDVIFLDTAGRSHKDDTQRKDLRDILSHIDSNRFDVEKYLCLSATTKYKDLCSIVKAYSDVTDYKLLFTKLDETLCYGNIYNIKCLTGAKLSYATHGQAVPEDIEVVNVQKMAKQLLGGGEG